MDEHTLLMMEINECLRGMVAQTDLDKPSKVPKPSKSESEWIPVKLPGIPGTLLRRKPPMKK